LESNSEDSKLIEEVDEREIGVGIVDNDCGDDDDDADGGGGTETNASVLTDGCGCDCGCICCAGLIGAVIGAGASSPIISISMSSFIEATGGVGSAEFVFCGDFISLTVVAGGGDGLELIILRENFNFPS